MTDTTHMTHLTYIDINSTNSTNSTNSNNSTNSTNSNYLTHIYDFKYVLKIILIGDTGIGKTCLIDRFCNNNFNPTHDITIGVEFGTKIIGIKESGESIGIKAQFWDTAGQEAYRSIVRSYYRSASGVILCYDVSQYLSFKNVISWLNEVKNECDVGTKIILVGTKLSFYSNRFT